MASKSVSVPRRQATGLPLINKSRSKLKQKKPRSHWVVYLASFISHRNTMIGVWNRYQKPSPAELAAMFELPRPADHPETYSPSSSSSSSAGTTDSSTCDRRQRNANGEPVKTIAELYACAAEVKDQFDKIVCVNNLLDSTHKRLTNSYAIIHRTYLALRNKFRVVDEIPDSNVEPNSMYISPLKDKEHAHKKAKQRYSLLPHGPAIAWVRDVVRCSFSCAQFADMKRIFDVICGCKDFIVMGMKNRFVHPTFANYRDLLLHVRLAAPAAPKFVCEIHFQYNDFQRYCLHHDGYEFYLYFRYFFLGCATNPKRLTARLKCIKKMDQLGENYDELERFVEDFLTMGTLYRTRT